MVDEEYLLARPDNCFCNSAQEHQELLKRLDESYLREKERDTMRSEQTSSWLRKRVIATTNGSSVS